MDQQFALDWVNRNIAGFGGDPDNITVFGESAGGLSTWSNLISPTAHGLFTKAIVESGAYSIQLPSLSEAETAGNAIAAAIGCAVSDTACLRAAPVATILAQESSPTLSLTTIVDGTTLPLSINTAIKNGQFNRVPIIQGSNHDEYRQFLTPYAQLTQAEYPAALEGIFGDALGMAVASEYDVTKYSQPVLALGAVLTDYAFACPANLLDHWAVRYTPVYAYEFNDQHAPQDFIPYAGYPFGAYHASEIQFLYTIPKLPGTPALTPAEQDLSKAMTQYWTNFGVNSNPSGAGIPAWPEFVLKSDNIQSLKPSGSFQERDFVAEHHCRFWAPVINPKAM